ncbi:ribosome silencing factor [Neoehrlichia mikurensis]|uniref:Ribosomal silencing factor RsfS n=1 Tax=Neoehrlichia mikurensis TaxID=89586 RepID=A0A9Q9BXU3_9RICK|nr:ribosome silencing factor [Neoehrlichia mikurensis]QXK91750.1 ribosome silencing factor [Neoehrlichia mikurensis]QXK92962.1 ribosome silencing factor [Neoehrlichia mikurensis]QXK93440.1 ribosome silencing factor [Neoehrlichia mikurensis]UTO55606.1 ribosome silencing factor [Neoehrlichia mikurensis]UTO56527.1 ribosome silencing factor [Neoehrlichia mikurensis]
MILDKIMMSTEQLKNLVISILDTHKANNISILDISDKSTLAKYMIIASGESTSHVKSLANNIKKKIKPYKKLSVEGLQDGHWVVISFQNIITHIFRPDVRDYYNLDDLWSNVTL